MDHKRVVVLRYELKISTLKIVEFEEYDFYLDTIPV